MATGTRSKTAAKVVHGRQLDDDDEESSSSNPTAFNKDQIHLSGYQGPYRLSRSHQVLKSGLLRWKMKFLL